MHLLLQKDSEINQGYSTMEGLCWVCCMSHQMMGLKSRRGEGPTATTSKNAAVPHHSHLQPAKSAGGASPVVPTDLDASSSICPTEGKGLTASRKVFLSPASFSPAQPTPRVLRLSKAARHHQWAASITMPPNISALMSGWLSASANSPQTGR